MDEWPARSPLAPAAPKATPHDTAHRTCESGSLIEFPILSGNTFGIKNGKTFARSSYG